MKLVDQSYARVVIAGVVMFLIGFGIGGTQGDRETVLNTVSAVLLTLGVLVVVGGLIFGVVRRMRHAASND
jgi:uncharacterized membrane protein YedE/YeeE